MHVVGSFRIVGSLARTWIEEERDRKESNEAEEKKGIGVTKGCDLSSSSADNEEAPSRPEGNGGA